MSYLDSVLLPHAHNTDLNLATIALEGNFSSMVSLPICVCACTYQKKKFFLIKKKAYWEQGSNYKKKIYDSGLNRYIYKELHTSWAGGTPS